jgi:hypothetical protein
LTGNLLNGGRVQVDGIIGQSKKAWDTNRATLHIDGHIWGCQFTERETSFTKRNIEEILKV